MSTKLVKLTPEDVADIHARLRDLHDLLPEYDEAESCGIDCSGHRAIRDQLFADLTALREKYSDWKPGDATAFS